MAPADSKPWETEQAPADAETKTADPDPDLDVKDPDAANDTQPTGGGNDAPKKPVVVKSKQAGNVVCGGPQADLALINLVSRGMSMKDAKKKLGMK